MFRVEDLEQMNLLNNKQLPKTITVFLLISGITYFVVQFFRQGEIEDLLRIELTQISANESMTWKRVELSDEECTIPLNNILPIFKAKTKFNSECIFNMEVDFSASNTNFEDITPSKRNITTVKSGDDNTSNFETYSITQKKSAVANISGIQNISAKTSTFQAYNIVQPINNGFQNVANFRSKSLTFSNTSSNSFLANNTLSIATELSDNNSPMMVSGTGNPGDPGVPVGDGMWIMLIMLLSYSFKKCLSKLQI